MKIDWPSIASMTVFRVLILGSALASGTPAIFSHALSSDPKLLSLVPPGARVVAGMDRPGPKGQPGSFVLMPHKNIVDLRDFFSLTGVDSTRAVGHAVFVANDDETLNERSLLMSGHFDQAAIYRSAVEGGARIIQYRGIAVLVIEAFARERGEMEDDRWLAVLDSDVLLFGSVIAVREELDRYLAHSKPDPLLVHKLARLRCDDETWTVLSRTALTPEIRKALVTLDPKLADLAANADGFQFGIRYGRQVEFEYEASADSSTVPQSPTQSIFVPGQEAALLPSVNMIGDGGAARRVVKIPRAKFRAWLEEAIGP